VKVIVDTSIWSLVLRRKRPAEHAATAVELQQLIEDYRVQMMGPIRQEILSGISDERLFKSVQEHLEAFRDLPTESEDYVNAASFYNTCHSKGVQGSNTDFLICAVAARTGYSIYTSDKDFGLFARRLPIKLYKPKYERGRKGR